VEIWFVFFFSIQYIPTIDQSQATILDSSSIFAEAMPLSAIICM
jgi:hypothetical protein